MRRALFVIASVIVSGLFLWLALRDVPLAEIATHLQAADPLWLLVSIATVFVSLYTRAIRWRGLLGFRITTRQSYMMLGVTFLLNQLPLRAGEVARSLLATRAGVPFMTAATSIIVERLLDTLIVVLMLALALTQLPLDLPAARQLALLFGLGAVLAFGVLVALARRPDIAHAIIGFIEKRIPLVERIGARRLLDHVLDGLEPLTHWRGGIHAIVWTIISWAWSIATFFTLEMAFGIGGSYGVTLSVMAISLASFSIAIPVSIASIGPWEGAVRLAGDGLQLAPSLSIALGFAFHGVSLLGYIALGILGLISQGVSLGEMLRAGEQSSAADVTR